MFFVSDIFRSHLGSSSLLASVELWFNSHYFILDLFKCLFISLFRAIYVYEASAVAKDRDLSALHRHGLARYSSHGGLQEHQGCRRTFPPRPFCREKKRYEKKDGYIQGSLLNGPHC